MKIKIGGMPWYVFLCCSAVVILASSLNLLQNNMMVAFTITVILGFFLNWLGNSTRLLQLIGAPALLCIFVPAILNSLHMIPEKTVEVISNFYTGYGYLDFFLAALLTGCILSMDRQTLIRASIRYAVPLLGGMFLAAIAAGLVGAITGYGFSSAILEVAMPIMGAGVGAGAVPMAKVYADATGGSSDLYLSTIVPAVIVGNLIAILLACLLNATGKKTDKPFKGYSGQGRLLRTGELHFDKEKERSSASFQSLAVGLAVSGTLYILGYLISKLFFPAIHAYAWTFIIAAVLKFSNLCPKEVEDGTGAWYGFVSYFGTPVVLVCISFTVIDMPQIIAAFTNPAYLSTIFVAVLFAGIGAGLGGYLVSMYFVESAITAGLCCANAGGAGDVAVLGAADRMELMPFATISSRIGGAIVLVLMSFLIPLLS